MKIYSQASSLFVHEERLDQKQIGKADNSGHLQRGSGYGVQNCVSSGTVMSRAGVSWDQSPSVRGYLS